MDNNKKYFDSPEFGRLLQRYERSLQMGKDEYFESDELSDIAEYYYDKKDKPRAEYVLDYAMHLHPGAVLPLVDCLRGGETENFLQVADGKACLLPQSCNVSSCCFHIN